MRYAAIDIRVIKQYRPLILLVVLALLPALLSHNLSDDNDDKTVSAADMRYIETAAAVDVGGEMVSGSDEYDGELTVPAYIRLDKINIEESVTPPLKSARISSHFGYRQNPVTGKYTFHSGCDLAAPQGNEIYAMYDGTVTTASYDENGYGYYIILDHPFGVQTLYAHCSKLLCSVGDTVDKGDCIALVGSTGNSTGAHLHVEFRQSGQRYDPEWIIGGLYS